MKLNEKCERRLKVEGKGRRRKEIHSKGGGLYDEKIREMIKWKKAMKENSFTKEKRKTNERSKRCPTN